MEQEATLRFDIPRDKSFSDTDVQCDGCGGHGCGKCNNRGWVPEGDPNGRKCARQDCRHMIPPNQVAVYCTDRCAFFDA